MKRLVAFFILLSLTLPAVAVEGGQVMYVGGTIPALTNNLVGRLDTTSETSLTFEYASNKLAIPYAAIESFQYSTEVTHHLGVLPGIVVALAKKREHRHFFRISYRDADNISQVAIFEVPKHMPRTLQAILNARAPGRSVYRSLSTPKDVSRPATRKDQGTDK
ncbi:MAG: hypothetical protein WBD25_16720 [Terriglobales bacterium]|jgi:hypothetical protein